MPRYAPNKMPAEVKRRYFELIRSGLSGSEASQRVGVSLSCGSLWFIDAGRVAFIDAPISPRFLSQDDRIEIADGLARGEPVKADRGPDRQELPDPLPGDRPQQQTRRPLPALVCTRAGASSPPASQDTGVRDRRRAGRRRGRAAGAAVVARSDQPVAAPPVSAPAGLACVHRDDLRGGLPGPGRAGLAAAAAHGPDLPAPPRPWPLPRRSAASVHRDEADPASVPPLWNPGGRQGTGREISSSALASGQRSRRSWSARPATPCWCLFPAGTLPPASRTR